MRDLELRHQRAQGLQVPIVPEVDRRHFGICALPDIDVPTGTELEEAGARGLSGASLEERRRDILETHRSLDARTHYELLEVPPDASDARVREAYFRAAKRFHPDGCHEAGLSDLRAPLEAIFARLAEAYAVLRSPRLRAEYLVTRAPAAAADSGAGSSGGPAEGPQDAIARAAQSVARERFWEALPILEDAVSRAGPGEARLRGRVLLARIYARDAEWLEKAEELLSGVVQDQPRHAEALHYLGMIHRHCGRQGPAVEAFRKVVELEPGRTESWRNLVELDEATPLPPEIRSALGR